MSRADWERSASTTGWALSAHHRYRVALLTPARTATACIVSPRKPTSGLSSSSTAARSTAVEASTLRRRRACALIGTDKERDETDWATAFRELVIPAELAASSR